MDPFTGSMLMAGGGQFLSSLGGLFSGGKEAEKAKERYHMSRDALLKQIGNTRIAYNKIGGLLEGNLAGIGDAFKGARANLSKYGMSARGDAMTQQAQQLAGLNSSLGQRGLGGTSVLQNLEKGVRSTTSRRLAEIDESTGQMFANLGLQEMSAKNAASSDLANFYAQRNQAEISDRNDLISLWLNTIPQGGNPMAGFGQMGMDIGKMMLFKDMFGGGGGTT